VQILSRRTLRQFWAAHPRAEGPLRAWFAEVARAGWSGPAEVKRHFGATVDFVGDKRLIFNIGGNEYRLIVHVSYRFGRVLVKFVGTHRLRSNRSGDGQ
jgi:mRNA interferase HigB